MLTLTHNSPFTLSFVGFTELFRQEVAIGSQIENGEQVFLGIRQWSQGANSVPLKNSSLRELVADINSEITQSGDWLKLSGYEMDAIEMRVPVLD